MDRRRFLSATTVSLAAGAMTGITQAQPAEAAAATSGGFKLKYAPGLGAFRAHVGGDPLENLRFAADEGFRAVFDNGLMGRSTGEQEAIARELAARNMELGPFVAYADFSVASMVTRDPDIRKMLRERMTQAVEVAKRTGARWALVVPGRFDPGLEWDYQTANVIDSLKYLAELCEPAGLVMVLEPLNAWTNHPGLFLTKIPQAYQICRAVGSPSCKIVNDLYHQQITEGNLIPNIDMAWSEIAAFHLGDNPGRKEPTTGEINYRNIFRHLHRKGYEGVLCMEHGQSVPGKVGERALIDAYRQCDDFEI